MIYPFVVEITELVYHKRYCHKYLLSDDTQNELGIIINN